MKKYFLIEITFFSFNLHLGSGMLGSWWFGGGPSSPDSNYLRVANAAFPNRRLSDNTLMTPKIRIAPSCASSPGKQNRRIILIALRTNHNVHTEIIFPPFIVLVVVCDIFSSFLFLIDLGGTPGAGLPIRR